MEKLANELSFLDLPSTMWGIHIHPQYEFIGILHINITNSKLMIDKGILLAEEQYGFKAKIFLNGFATHVPNVISNITNLSELSALVYLLHDKNMCRNFAEIEQGSKCLKLIDNEFGDNVIYCSMCQENKHNVRVLTNDVMEPYNEEVSESVNILNSLEEHIVEFCIICNKHIHETDKIKHKKQCKQFQDQLKSNSNKTESSTKSEKLNPSKENEALCNFCGKIFPKGQRLEEHMFTHTKEKPFQCKICHKTFSKHFNLKMHEHTHSGDRPYICSVCGKSYTTSSNLRAHTLSSHSNEKKHICDICKMTFLYPRYLKIHMRKHTGERPFVCSICGKKFSKNIHLTIHTRTHTGEKPHCCQICGKAFITTGGLGYHKRVHHKNSNL